MLSCADAMHGQQRSDHANMVMNQAQSFDPISFHLLLPKTRIQQFHSQLIKSHRNNSGDNQLKL